MKNENNNEFKSIYRNFLFSVFLLLVFPTLCYSASVLVFNWEIPEKIESYIDGFVISSPSQDRNIVIDDPSARTKEVEVYLEEGVNEFFIQGYKGKEKGPISKVSSIVKIPRINNFNVTEKETRSFINE